MDLSLETLILHLQVLLSSYPERFTSNNLQKALAERLSTTRRQALKYIHQLVNAGELVYSNEDGHTFLVPSFQRPVRVSERVLLAPPNRELIPGTGPKDVVVRLIAGSAFGSGSHPTTRLAIRAIDTIMSRHAWLSQFESGSVLDIGTGTGELIITALQLGMKDGLGIDVDPCARSEARENAKLNGFEGQIRITAESIRKIEESFALIAANLRLPSLIRYYSPISNLAVSGGIVVLSGIRTAEASEIERYYGRPPFRKQWHSEENGWGSIAYRKIK